MESVLENKKCYFCGHPCFRMDACSECYHKLANEYFRLKREYADFIWKENHPHWERLSTV